MSNHKSPPNVIDLTSKRFGKLTVIKRAGKTKNDNALWLCKCDCGETTIAMGTSLRRGDTVSCGCDKAKQIDHARKILMTDKTIDGVNVPLMTKKVRTDSATGIKGVHKRNRKGKITYEVSIAIKGKRKYLGTFNKIDDAIAARKKAEKIYIDPVVKRISHRRKGRQRKWTNIAGKKFGRLTIIKEASKVTKLRRVLCRCDCGNQVTVDLQSLTSGNTKSCGCLRNDHTRKAHIKDLTGHKIGSLTVIKLMPYHDKFHNSVWLCKKDEGKLIELSRPRIMANRK